MEEAPVIRRPQAEDIRGFFLSIPSVRGARYLTCFFIQVVVTLFGRSIGEPIARLMISCDSMPIERLTENSTV